MFSLSLAPVLIEFQVNKEHACRQTLTQAYMQTRQ